MRGRKKVGRNSGGTVPVLGWIVAGASVVSSATAVAMSAVALHRIAGRLGERESAPGAPAEYDRVRISSVGSAPKDSHVPVLRSVAAVPPENPHAPPTPALGNPIIRR